MNKIPLILVAVLASPVHADDWVDSWFDKAVYSGPSAFEGQDRTFLTGGSFSARVKMKTDYPVTISKPRIRAGCGGIDGFLGGFSFLDADYLVDKGQRMLQAAPYIAVDMALKTMSKEMSDTLAKAEDLMNALNSIQINECQAMKPVVATMFGEDPSSIQETWGEMLNKQQIEDSVTRFWQESKDTNSANGNAVTEDLKNQISGCSTQVKELFAGGSVIARIAAKTSMTDHADLMRGYFGDVSIDISNNVPMAYPISACSANSTNIDGFLYGGGEEKDSTGACRATTGEDVYDRVETLINDIHSKLLAGRVLTAEESEFANQRTRLPVIRLLQAGIESGQIDAVKSKIIGLTAASYATSVAEEFYLATRTILKEVSDTLKNPTIQDPSKRCNMQVYAPAASQVKDLLVKTRYMKGELNSRLIRAINEETAFQQVADSLRTLRKERKNTEQKLLAPGG